MQSELNPSQDQENVPDESMIEKSEAIMPDEIFTFPPIAGFWRRFFAWLADMVILGVMGQIIAIIFSSFFFGLGPYGRPIGLLFTLPYFGIMNSRMVGGQTFGKRWMKIAVRNKNNGPIELWRSIIRISILALPPLFNLWAIPVFQNYVIKWFLSLIIFGLGGAILYTMIFNRKTRQGLHDLLLGTYVVHIQGKAVESFPASSRIHWIVAGGWVTIIAISTLGTMFIAPTIMSSAPLASTKSLYDILQDDPRFFTVGVNDNTFYGSNGKTSRSLIITVWYKGKIEESEREKVVAGIVKTVLDNEKKNQ